MNRFAKPVRRFCLAGLVFFSYGMNSLVTVKKIATYAIYETDNPFYQFSRGKAPSWPLVERGAFSKETAKRLTGGLIDQSDQHFFRCRY
jgi:hypothetical protein